MNIKKYLAATKIEWQRAMTYRADFFGYRTGNFLEILIQVVIWTAIFQRISVVGGYNYHEMMTYIIIGWVVSTLAGNFGFENIVARHIQQGDLSNFVTKPISYINFIVSFSIGRASIALLSVFIMSIVLIMIFAGVIALPANIFSLIIVVAMLLVSYFIKLFLAILTGFIAFWTVDISGIFFSISALSRFLAGFYFPLNILPAAFVNFGLALPFAYTFYFPTQLYLGKVSLQRGLMGLGVEILWLVILYFVIKLVWKIGLKKYESVGI